MRDQLVHLMDLPGCAVRIPNPRPTWEERQNESAMEYAIRLVNRSAFLWGLWGLTEPEGRPVQLSRPSPQRPSGTDRPNPGWPCRGAGLTP